MFYDIVGSNLRLSSIHLDQHTLLRVSLRYFTSLMQLANSKRFILIFLKNFCLLFLSKAVNGGIVGFFNSLLVELTNLLCTRPTHMSKTHLVRTLSLSFTPLSIPFSMSLSIFLFISIFLSG